MEKSVFSITIMALLIAAVMSFEFNHYTTAACFVWLLGLYGWLLWDTDNPRILANCVFYSGLQIHTKKPLTVTHCTFIGTGGIEVNG